MSVERAGVGSPGGRRPSTKRGEEGCDKNGERREEEEGRSL